MSKIKKRGVVATTFQILVAYALAFVVDSIASRVGSVQYGKDDGMAFRIICTCFLGSAFFSFGTRRRKFILFLWGFFFGLLSYSLTFVVYYLFSMLLKGDNSGWDVLLLVDQLIATSFVLIFGLLFRSNRHKKYHNANIGKGVR